MENSNLAEERTQPLWSESWYNKAWLDFLLALSSLLKPEYRAREAAEANDILNQVPGLLPPTSTSL